MWAQRRRGHPCDPRIGGSHPHPDITAGQVVGDVTVPSAAACKPGSPDHFGIGRRLVERAAGVLAGDLEDEVPSRTGLKPQSLASGENGARERRHGDLLLAVVRPVGFSTSAIQRGMAWGVRSTSR